jgi:hypothetical protein
MKTRFSNRYCCYAAYCFVAYISRGKRRFIDARKGFKNEASEQRDAPQHGEFTPCLSRPGGSKPAVSGLYPGPHFSEEACSVKRADRSRDEETSRQSLLLSVAMDRVRIPGDPSK